VDTHEPPSMQSWQEAWADADGAALRQCYTDTALVIPPGHATLKGPEAIVGFFRGGFSSILVRFFPEQRVLADRLVLETGIVRDLDRTSGAVVEVCDYAVTWARTDAGWKLAVHTWSVAHGEGTDGA
jgi:ketosteroid isomerase-like protein